MKSEMSRKINSRNQARKNNERKDHSDSLLPRIKEDEILEGNTGPHWSFRSLKIKVKQLFSGQELFMSKSKKEARRHELAARESLSFARLREANFKELDGSNLTFGQLVDVCNLYLISVKSQGDHAKQSLQRIIDTQFHGESEFTSLVDNIFNSKEVDISSSAYSSVVDLESIVSNDEGDLTHYPGGLTLEYKRRIYEDSDGKFSVSENPKLHFILTNRQQADKGKSFIKTIFTDLDLPVVSHIQK